MPSQASDERVALPPSTRMETKNEAKGRKRTGEPNSQVQAVRHMSGQDPPSFSRPKMKREQQSGKEQNNYDGHEQNTQGSDPSPMKQNACQIGRICADLVDVVHGCLPQHKVQHSHEVQNYLFQSIAKKARSARHWPISPFRYSEGIKVQRDNKRKLNMTTKNNNVLFILIGTRC